MTAASDSRSATVTGERSGFSSTRTPERKYFRDAAAAASAARRAVVIARSRSREGMGRSIIARYVAIATVACGRGRPSPQPSPRTAGGGRQRIEGGQGGPIPSATEHDPELL